MKNKLFLPLMLLVSIALFLFRLTGLPAHVAVSVIGAVIMIAFAVMMRGESKKPVLDIIVRVLFALAFVSGVLVMRIHGVLALAIAHKVFAALFVVMLLVVYIPRMLRKQ